MPNLSALIVAGLEAANRELWEELELPAVALFFADRSINSAGWDTFTYAADLETKPKLVVNPESAGTRWLDQEKIIHGKPKMLSGHLGMARRAIQALNARLPIGAP